jgi:DNA-binding MarR family transcriptional regulator
VDATGLQRSTTGLPVLDDNEQRSWQLFLDSSTQILATVNRRLMTAHQLSLFDVLLLDLLAESERGAARISVLADALMVVHARVAKRIRTLQNRRLVARAPSRYDRRGVLVSITGFGRARLESAIETYAQEVRTHCLDRMPGQEMIELADSHRRIGTPLEALRAAGVARLAVL